MQATFSVLASQEGLLSVYRVEGFVDLIDSNKTLYIAEDQLALSSSGPYLLQVCFREK